MWSSGLSLATATRKLWATLNSWCNWKQKNSSDSEYAENIALLLALVYIPLFQLYTTLRPRQNTKSLSFFQSTSMSVSLSVYLSINQPIYLYIKHVNFSCFLELHGIVSVLYCVELNNIVLYCIVFHSIVLHCMLYLLPQVA